jgi:hypothetical protein
MRNKKYLVEQFMTAKKGTKKLASVEQNHDYRGKH